MKAMSADVHGSPPSSPRASQPVPTSEEGRAGRSSFASEWMFGVDYVRQVLRWSIVLAAVAGVVGWLITTEIASGRFEDDIRRMRMAAWHGADHIMVIRTAGQSHIDGLLEGTPEGVGGIAVTRKQCRATRRALDLIEDEVGRPINYHSYVSGVAASSSQYDGGTQSYGPVIFTPVPPVTFVCFCVAEET